MKNNVKWLLPAILLTGVNAQVPAPKAIDLRPGTAPGSEAWKQPETTVGNAGNRRIMNVGTPTLTAYLPHPSTAAGTVVIAAPGGGFVWLSIDSEGHDVAKWLAARGIVGIVLKYRLFQVEGKEPAQVTQSATAALNAVMRERSLVNEYGKFGIADGIHAVKVVRARAANWGISPERVVLMGFSVGAILTSAVALQSEARPNYAAPIYGGPFNEVPPIPQGLPPIFLAIAQDDAGAEPLVTRFHSALKAAGYRPELHMFSSGGHGFGMRKQGKSSDHRIDEFCSWVGSVRADAPGQIIL